MRRTSLIIALMAILAPGCKATFGDVGAVEIADDAAPGPDADFIPPEDAGGPIDPTPCPETATQTQDPVTGHCFIFIADLLTWNAAQEACQAIGPTTHLAVSTSQQENDVFTPLAGVLDVWVGATDFLEEGEFIWLNFEPMVYRNFRANEPNNGGIAGEDCMIIEGELGGSWDDRACTQTLGYICERE